MDSLQPIIAILTDFGTSDWYVASMKAVIAQICPQARTIDITHQIEPGNVRSAAFVLSQCYNDFPQGTIFLCVVDPGVGTSRHPIIHYDGDYHFVAPDNGILGLLKPGMCRTYEIEPYRITRTPRISNTFHGRDVFAPAAAELANGRDPASFSRPLPRISHPGMEFPVITHLPTNGTVVYFDHFGNGISSLQITAASPIPSAVVLSDGTKIPFANSFADVPKGSPVAYLGSGGFLEIAINLGNARHALNLESESSFKVV